MPIDIQTGGLAENLRRVLGVRGRMPLKLDETIVPVALVTTIDVPPSRQIPTDFMGNHTQAAVAAEYPFIGLNISPAVSGAAVVEKISFWAAGADTYVLHLGPTAEYGATATNPVDDFRDVEHTRDNSGVTGILPPTMAFQNLHGTHPTLGIGSRIWSGRALAGEERVLCGRWTVRPGWVLALWRATVNTTLEVTWQGTYYPDAPRS